MGTLKEQIDELTAKVIAKDGELAALKTAHEQVLSDIGQNAAAKLAEMQGKIDASNSAVADAQNAVVAEVTKNGVLIGDLAAVKAALVSAESKLANPAFDHASAKGVAPLSEVNSENGIETPEQFQARYDAESDPVKKTLMWEARRKKMAEQKD